MPHTLPVLVTHHLTLRKPLEVDLEAIARCLDDLEVSRWLGSVPHPYTLADAREWFEHVETGPRDRRWTIHDATGLVGVVSIGERLREDLPNDDLELGYWLARDRWGRGYMGEAARAVVADHFARGGGDLVSGAQEGNPASLAIQERLGFTRTHELRLPSKALGRDVSVLRTKLTREAFEQRHAMRDAA